MYTYVYIYIYIYIYTYHMINFLSGATLGPLAPPYRVLRPPTAFAWVQPSCKVVP